MGWLTRLCVQVLGGAALLCVMALAMGRASALVEPAAGAEGAAGLASCAGKPCLLGITPGSTGWQAALHRLRGHPNARLAAKAITLATSPTSYADLFISVDRVNVGRMAIKPSAHMTAGWLVAQFGLPCGITIYRYSETVTLRYPTMLVNIHAPAHRVRATTPLDQINILDPAFKSDFQRNMCVDNVTDGARNYRWAGFAQARYYYQHPTLWQR